MKHVYFMKSEQTGLIKIGKSNIPARRQQELQKLLQDRLEIIATFTGLDEGYLHKRFRDLRARHPNHAAGREWFRPSPSLFAFIEEQTGIPKANQVDDIAEINRRSREAESMIFTLERKLGQAEGRLELLPRLEAEIAELKKQLDEERNRKRGFFGR